MPWKVAVAFIACLLAAPAQAITVDLDAREDVRFGNIFNPFFVVLDPGSYTVMPVAGKFTAWNAWNTNGSTRGCEGDACQRGWVNNWSMYTPDTDLLPQTLFKQSTGVEGRKAWATPELALANAVSATLVLSETQRVGFFIRDNPIRDNTGGMSLRIAETPAAIPLPASIFLLLGGLGTLILGSIRRV